MLATKILASRIPAVAVLVCFVSICAGAGEGQWPRFRGPNGAGISDAKTVPVKWTDKDYNWTLTLPGMGHSSPVAWSDRIFVTCGNRKTATRTVMCVGAADGKTLWRRDYESKPFKQHRDNDYMSATPAADAAGVVATWTTPKEVILRALDRDGQEVWQRDVGEFVGMHGSASSPIIVGDLVVLASEQADPKAMPFGYLLPGAPKVAGKSFLIALDRKTGKTRWKINRRSSQAAYSTPCVYRRSGGPSELIFSSTSHGITAVDPETGKVNWNTGRVFRERCIGSPITAPGLVLAGHGGGSRGLSVVAVRPGSRKPAAKPSVAYKIKRPVPLVPTLLVKGGRLFMWGDYGKIACLDVSSGKVIWRDRVSATFYGSPVCVNDKLYCISKKGEVFVIAAGDKFKLLGRTPLGEASFATPAVCGGVMYLRTHTKLFSLGGAKPKASR